MRFTSIRIVLPLMIVVPLAITASILEWVALRDSQAAVSQVSTLLSEKVIAQSRDRVSTYLGSHLLVLQVAAEGAASGDLSVGEECLSLAQEERCLQQISKFLLGQVSTDNAIQSMLYASPLGSYAKIDRVEDEYFLDQRLATTNHMREFSRPDLEAFGWQLDRDQPTLYNPLARAWYQLALETNRPVLGDVYSFASGGQGVTASVPLRNPDGLLLGVLAIDLPLDRLHTALTEIGEEVSPSARISIVEDTRSGPIVISGAPPDEDQQWLQEFNCAFDCEPGTVMKIEGVSYLVSTTVLQQGEDWLPRWLVTAIVPESDFVGELNENFVRSAILAFSLVAVTAVLGVIASTRWIASPVSRLGQAARDIEGNQFDPDSIDHLTERSDELGQLAKLFRRMGMAIDRRMTGFSEEIEHLQALNQEFAAERERNSIKDATHYRSLLNRSKAIRERSKRN
ncbi:MAG: HAMP domain-containing protein [Cyanobacteria bacterium J06597_1]